jgi:hypothetical protein
MPLAQRLVQAGLSAVQAAAIAGTVADNLTATGTTQGGALALGADTNRLTTVSANSGAILPAMNPGDSVEVINVGANALKLYPPVGGQINALGTNAAYSIATATPYCTVTCTSPTQYHAFQSS